MLSGNGDLVNWRRAIVHPRYDNGRFLNCETMIHPTLLRPSQTAAASTQPHTCWHPAIFRAQLVMSCVLLSSRIGMYTSYHFFWAGLSAYFFSASSFSNSITMMCL
jgi:hypothetical protein